MVYGWMLLKWWCSCLCSSMARPGYADAQLLQERKSAGAAALPDQKHDASLSFYNSLLLQPYYSDIALGCSIQRRVLV